ncbi:hypothetical protein HHI36_004811 [Cryptolaemus montrouzieri]|uniref:Uncharacterized protein n=1 Tax=Cryptolaemus montrouzieri TaxID=559131 RepID=A0ABD2NSY3_9CUCU
MGISNPHQLNYLESDIVISKKLAYIIEENCCFPLIQLRKELTGLKEMLKKKKFSRLDIGSAEKKVTVELENNLRSMETHIKKPRRSHGTAKGVTNSGAYIPSSSRHLLEMSFKYSNDDILNFIKGKIPNLKATCT